MLVSFKEFVVEEYPPLCVHDFTTAMSHKILAGRLAGILGDKIFKRIRQL
jgi:hypothetical protein